MLFEQFYTYYLDRDNKINHNHQFNQIGPLIGQRHQTHSSIIIMKNLSILGICVCKQAKKTLIYLHTPGGSQVLGHTFIYIYIQALFFCYSRLNTVVLLFGNFVRHEVWCCLRSLNVKHSIYITLSCDCVYWQKGHGCNDNYCSILFIIQWNGSSFVLPGHRNLGNQFHYVSI